MIENPRLVSPKITRQEWQFVCLMAIVVLSVTSLPYVYGYLSSPADKQFMGILMDVPDHGQYLSWWRSFQSSFLVTNKLTPETTPQIFFNLLWWGLAQVTRLTGLDYAPLFQTFRWFAGGAVFFTYYHLISQFFNKKSQRYLGLLLFSLTSGFGLIWVILKYTITGGNLLYPLDIYIAEGNTFLCVMAFPHFTIALALIIFTLDLFWQGWIYSLNRYMVFAGLTALILGWMHAYDLFIVYGVTGVFFLGICLINKTFHVKLFSGILILVGLSFSGALYSYLLIILDPSWREVLSQFKNAGVYTPGPVHLVVLFGWPLVLALFALYRLALKKDWSERNIFILGWFVIGLCLNYIPTDFQIHMLNSWQTPVIFLAMFTINDILVPWLENVAILRKQRRFHWKYALIVCLILPTNFYLLSWRIFDLSRHDYPYYLSNDDISALKWLRINSSSNDVVLSSLTIGQFIPALSGNTAYLAHWAQTLDFYGKEQAVADFYSQNTSNFRRKEIVRENSIQYVFNGESEKVIGSANLIGVPFLEKVYDSGGVELFKVTTQQ